MIIESATVVGIISAVLHGIDNALSFSPDGYPKSLFQAIVWIGHKIYRCFKRSKDEPTEEEQEGLVEVRI